MPEVTSDLVVVLGQGPLSVELAGLLDAAGIPNSIVPTTRIVPVEDHDALEDAVRDLAQIGWIVVTSAAAAPLVARALRGRPLPVTLKVAAVGPATAEALRAAGLAVDHVGEGRGGAALAAGLGLPPWPGAIVVLPRSSLARTEIDEVLAGAGYVVQPVVVYETQSIALEPAALSTVRAAGCVVAAAPSALASLLAAGVVPDVVAAIGATTAEAALRAGARVVTAASSPNAAGLYAAVQVAFRRRGEGA